MQLAIIVAKLRRLLSAPFESEEQLLAFFVNVRKALDCEAGLPDFSTLRFHCNWMVHHALSRGAAAELLAHVDHYQDVIIDNAMQASPTPLGAAAFKALADLDDLMYFRRFRAELRSFLERHDLSQDAVDDDRWPEFLKIYISSVESSPLQYEAPKKKNAPPSIPPDVQQVTVSLLDYKPAGTGSDFRIMWVWDWPNGDPDFPMGMRRVLFL